jgi:hypothetical protein
MKSTPAALVGYVDAPDAESAIKRAIEEFEITDPQKQRQVGCAGGAVSGSTSTGYGPAFELTLRRD